MSNISDQLADFLIRWRSLFFWAAVGLGVLGWWKSESLDYDRSVESMFAPDDPILVPYQKLKKTFGGNEIALAVYEDPQLMNEDGSGIKRLEKIASECAKVDGVKDVLSLAEVNRALEKIYPSGMLPFGDGTPPIVNKNDALAKEFVSIFEGYTHSADLTVVSIVCMLDPESETPRGKTIDELRAIIKKLDGQLTGEPALIVDGFRYVEQDGNLLGWSSTLLLAFVIVVSFRSLRWVAIPLVIMQLTLWSTQGILVMAGFQLSMVSSMLHAIVTVISVATVVHLIVWYRAGRAEGLTHSAAVQQAIHYLAEPIAWACLTDAVGFAALMVADVGPVRDFGLMMALASLLVLFNVVMVVPTLALFGSSFSDRNQGWDRTRLNQFLGFTASTIRKQPIGLAILIFIGVTIVSIGIFWMRVETDFTRNFRKSTQISKAYQYVELHLGGAGVFDVMVPAPKTMSPDFLKRINELENDLREIKFESGSMQGQKALTKVISLADADRAARKSQFLIRSLPPEAVFAGMSSVMPTFSSAMRSAEPDENGIYYFRIMLRTTQQQDAEQTRWLIESVQQTVEKHFPEEGENPAGKTTGFFVLLSQLVNSVLGDQLMTFCIAAICIYISMTIALRSFSLGFIALIPNLVPITVVMGALGWFGIKINMGSAMIAAVSVGLSIDSTIHYLWSYRRQLKRSGSVTEAIEQAQKRVGRAATFSTLALVAGFLTLVISKFIPTIYFGILVSVTMVGGLFGNLVILPILLQLFFGGRSTIVEKMEPS